MTGDDVFGILVGMLKWTLILCLIALGICVISIFLFLLFSFILTVLVL
jgi:hypothetical protein